MNKDTKIKARPGVGTLPIDIVNSVFKIFIPNLNKFKYFLLSKKNFCGIATKNKYMAIQFKLNNKIEDTGSNTEKREFIIISVN